MPRQDDWDEDDEDWESDDEDDEPTIRCPYCKREIHEDAQRCPYCEQYISAEDSASPRKPWWIVLGVILALAIILGWMLG
jgi:hypothetical protein